MLTIRSHRTFALIAAGALLSPVFSVVAAESDTNGAKSQKPVQTMSVDQVTAMTVGTQGGAAEAAKGASLTASGDVTVDGAAATTGGTVFSGSRIKTGKGSSATVSYNGMQVTLLE